uniref:uncharacterized protein LOC109955446 n=1 Tax=Monopterus albus TaxID=43700 RepID=UPI0009B4C67B|nr:uncharacterized protein LOC109955446 [Monopterus albus]
MASSADRPQNCRTNIQTARRNKNMNCEAPHEEIRRLQGMLSRGRENFNYEQNWRIQFSQELSQTKEQLAYQKAKTEDFIKREKEARKELERLRQYCDAEALSASNIASQVANSIKRRKKKDLQKDYEDLKVAYTICQKRFTDELNAERNKNSALQEELEKLRASHHELSLRGEDDSLALKQRVESFHSEHETENKSHSDTVEQDLQLIDTLKAEKAALKVENNSLKADKDALQRELETEKLTHANMAEQDLKMIET